MIGMAHPEVREIHAVEVAGDMQLAVTNYDTPIRDA